LQVGRAKQKQEEAAKKAKKAQEEFAHFLRHAKGLYHDTPWDLFEEKFQDEPEFKAVSKESHRGRLDNKTNLGMGVVACLNEQKSTSQNSWW
jgi:hypothetical protein